VIVAGTAPELWRALCAHRWREVFVERRDELLRSTRFVVFGHASHDALARPLSASAARRCSSRSMLAGWICRRPNRWPNSMRGWRRRWPPATFFAARLAALPLLGIPGATAENEHAAYYEDERQFRPPRRMAAGSSPGNR
jgi:hypothetical protein